MIQVPIGLVVSYVASLALNVLLMIHAGLL
jgi:hypothetical protein